MKAQTFLEYFEQFNLLEKAQSISVYRGESNYSYEEPYIYAPELYPLLEYQKFVSQPFRPEMIERLFEIIIREESGSKRYVKFYIADVVITFKYRSDNSFFSYYIIETDKFLFPKTLNDFISDCQRAGIDLEFKEEISRKF